MLSRDTTTTNAWTTILPKGVFVSSGVLEDVAMPLSVNERMSLGHVSRVRMHEFALGRMHAHKALEQMGIYNSDIPKNNQTGSPIWPASAVGSLAHTRNGNKSYVVAIAAKSSEFLNLGVDAEWNSNLHPNMWSQYMSIEEMDLIIDSPVFERNALACKLWTLKEAAFKAIGKGDLTTWRVLKQTSSETFQMMNSTLYENVKLYASVIGYQDMTFAVVYRDARIDSLIYK